MSSVLLCAAMRQRREITKAEYSFHVYLFIFYVDFYAVKKYNTGVEEGSLKTEKGGRNGVGCPNSARL
jgi:hypothetical protein